MKNVVRLKDGTHVAAAMAAEVATWSGNCTASRIARRRDSVPALELGVRAPSEGSWSTIADRAETTSAEAAASRRPPPAPTSNQEQDTRYTVFVHTTLTTLEPLHKSERSMSHWEPISTI